MGNARGDIAHNDVFISWTGADRNIKNKIKTYLTDRGISCTDSEESCQGNFEQWSREAAGACEVFLLLMTENARKSVYVPQEIRAAFTMDDTDNRFLIVCPDIGILKKTEEGGPLFEQDEALDFRDHPISAVACGEDFTDSALDEICRKTVSLLINRIGEIYRERTKPEYIKLASNVGGLSGNVGDENVPFGELYLNRMLTEWDGDERLGEVSTEQILREQKVVFIYGTAGVGKSQYINQIKECCLAYDGESAWKKEILTVCLPCARVASREIGIAESICGEIRTRCARPEFGRDNLRRLLELKRLLLIFDGMDEIPTAEETRSFIARIEQFEKDCGAGDDITYIVTSRNRNDGTRLVIGDRGVRVFELEKMTQEQSKNLGERLFLCFGAREREDGFYAELADIREEIRQNPLLFSQMAIIYQYRGELPRTLVGIFDAITDITLKGGQASEHVPEQYRVMIDRELVRILHEYSLLFYRKAAEGKTGIATDKYFAKILRREYPNDAGERAEFLVDYLAKRAIMVEGEFYHKMMLEYFAALAYYERIFDDFDELEDEDTLRELFGHYGDDYWASLIKLFLVKADSAADEAELAGMYRVILELWEGAEPDYELLLDTCRDLIRHKEGAQKLIAGHILEKSAKGVYPPYGPLCWYIPEYDLYEPLALALRDMAARESAKDGEKLKALALVRDVCYLYQSYDSLAQVTDRIDGEAFRDLLAQLAEVSQIRAALCEMFYLGNTQRHCPNVYPRCFDVEECRSLRDYGMGLADKRTEAFADELALYVHDMLGESDPTCGFKYGGAYMGLVAIAYEDDREEIRRIEKALQGSRRINGIILSGGDEPYMRYMDFYRRNIRVFYLPEGCKGGDRNPAWDSYIVWDRTGTFWAMGTKQFYRKDVVMPGGVTMIHSRQFQRWNFLETFVCSEETAKIGKSAFSECRNLESIELPAGVTEIDEFAFSECESLESIELPAGVTKIGLGAFSACKSLERIELPAGVTEIGGFAFQECESLKSIELPAGVTKMGGGVFEGCKSLESIELPVGVTKIGNSAFHGCESLESIELPAGVTEIDMDTFRDCESLESIELPAGVTAIGFGAFAGCKSLESIELPAGVTAICGSAFAECESLESIELPAGVIIIGEGAFSGCESIRSIEIPVGVTKIERAVFVGCKSLCSIKLPDGLTLIDENAFRGCKNLREIEIPESVGRIEGGALSGCDGLAHITIPERFRGRMPDLLKRDSDGIQIRYTTSEERQLVLGADRDGRLLMPENMDHSVTSVIVEEGVASIGERAFEDCGCLTEIKLPGSLRKIDWYAFSGCGSLSDVELPAGVKKIGRGAFASCGRLEHIELPEGIDTIYAKLFSCCKNLKSIVIPDRVTTIESDAFYGCISMVSIEIPDRVTLISDRAFAACTSLREIELPGGIDKIGSELFRDCISLTDIAIPLGVCRIHRDTFQGCVSLEEVRIPESVLDIDDCAFSHCHHLSRIRLPGQLKYLGSGAFSYCNSLYEIELPAHIEVIEHDTFSHCDNLRAVYLPERLAAIRENAFEACGGLREIDLSHAAIVEKGAFRACTGLEKITVPGDANWSDEASLQAIFEGVDLGHAEIKRV